MSDRIQTILLAALLSALGLCGRALTAERVGFSTGTEVVVLAKHKTESSGVRVEPARLDSTHGIALIFEGTDDLHYYAEPDTAPAPGLELKVKAESDQFEFGPAVFPQPEPFTDSLGRKIKVYEGRFAVFLPIIGVKSTAAATVEKARVEVTISGIACTSRVCLSPFERTVRATIDWGARQQWKQAVLKGPDGEHEEVRPATAAQSYSAWVALPLALLAGLILNIMPCVLPVIPLKVLSIFEQAKESKARCIALGLAFCLGILLFFACLAGVNIILRLGYGTVFQWGDHFRNPLFIIGMSLLLVVLAMFMFGAVTLVVPSSVAGRARPRKGYGGSIAMGFLAAVLSTPCSFAILTAAFAWAQTQHLVLATTTIMLIGVGMAGPYAVLTAMPGLLKHIPKAGRWTELFKQTMGFVLLLVAVWLLLALPPNRLPGVAYFATILAFCLWMWGGWVNLMTPRKRKIIVRSIALVIAVAAGLYLLGEPRSHVNWQQYDRALVEEAIGEGRPVLIEFSAEWCVNCKAVEKFVYSRKEVAGLIKQKGVLAVRADTTLNESPATIDMKKLYKEPAVPVTMLFVPGSDEPLRFRGVLIRDRLLDALRSLPDAQPVGKESGSIGQAKTTTSQ